MYYGHTPETIGAEIEGGSLNRDVVTKMVGDLLSRGVISIVTRDASVESTVCPISPKVNLFLGSKFLRESSVSDLTANQSVIGYEIVTAPLRRTEIQDSITVILNRLTKAGEIFSPRASIHVHIGFPYGTMFLKNIVRMGLKVEPLLYKIAGMGNIYRGQINKSAYARPFASPPAIRDARNNKYLVLSPERALEAAGDDEFWRYFAWNLGQTDRYVPLRYFGINVYSVAMRGTLEFRHFNFTPSHSKINSTIELCQMIADLMIRLPERAIDSMHTVSLFESNSSDSYFRLLETLISLSHDYDSPFKLSSMAEKNLYKLVETTPQPVFTKEVVRTHLGKYAVDGSDWPELSYASSTVDPGIIDVHNFTSGDRSIISE